MDRLRGVLDMPGWWREHADAARCGTSGREVSRFEAALRTATRYWAGADSSVDDAPGTGRHCRNTKSVSVNRVGGRPGSRPCVWRLARGDAERGCENSSRGRLEEWAGPEAWRGQPGLGASCPAFPGSGRRCRTGSGRVRHAWCSESGFADHNGSPTAEPVARRLALAEHGRACTGAMSRANRRREAQG